MQTVESEFLWGIVKYYAVADCDFVSEMSSDISSMYQFSK